MEVTMKKGLLVFIFVFIPMLAFAQLKSQTKMPSISDAIAKPNTGSFFGLFDPTRLSMHHSFSMSYMTMGSAGGMMVNSYMNTIDYQISNPLFLRLNLGLMNIPYSSLQNPVLNNTQFFGGAELYYRPSDNTLLKFGFDVRPGYYGPGYYNNGWYGW
jgi:hypothetical protein